ncbi:protein STPG4 [Oncorhynchus nerka]|uniref:protein STPG4 n=1 Tax=Oncorhynchus nerka TaxID=8023 RepID=UPI0011300EA5|nr:protein STPG4 [Oncorhynchus nerka]
MTVGKNMSKVSDIPCDDASCRTEERGNEKGDQCDRGRWWMGTLKDTPIPGSYHIRDFIEEAGLNPVRMTYGFKGTGRDTKMQMRKGDLLLPGAYCFTDSTQEALQFQASYSFKSCPRPKNYTLGIRDKEIDLSPCHYNVTQKPVPKIPCKHVMFRSAVQRASFLPREGPAPGHYNIRTGPTIGVTSCFRSTVPRLHSVRSRTPGPGTYEPSWQMGHRLGTEANMGRAHGLFFRNVF